MMCILHKRNPYVCIKATVLVWLAILLLSEKLILVIRASLILLKFWNQLPLNSVNKLSAFVSVNLEKFRPNYFKKRKEDQRSEELRRESYESLKKI